MKIKIFRIEEKIDEKQFPEYIHKLGFKCKKLKYSNHDFIKEILGMDFKLGLGMPDFLIYNTQEKYLCEFKSFTDSWHNHQIKWMLDNFEVPFALAFVDIHPNKKISEVYDGNLEVDTEFEDMLKIINISWRIKEIYWQEYANQHQEEIGVNFMMNGHGGFWGMIPQEVSLKQKKFDEIYFKDKYKQQRLIKLYKENKIKTSQDIELLL